MTVPTPRVSRSGGSALTGPVAVAAACVCGAGVLARHDPESTGWYPGCPFHALTGWWCPGCGLTRAAARLVRGDLAGALATNALLPLVLLAVGIGWLSWVQTSRGRPAPALARRWRPAWTVWVGVTVALFTVGRNLGPFTALAP